MPISEDTGRKHLERFRAPASIREELTELATQGGSLVWARPGLAPAQRSIATISVLVSLGRLGALREHLEIGKANGLSEREMCEAIMQCGVYAGFPAMVEAMEVAADVFDGPA